MALTFQVRIGIPGSLTIELDAVPTIVAQNPTNLFAQLNQPPLRGDDKLLDKTWGQGWATPMTNRLIALGGNLDSQLLAFECPSIDTTDNAWGATASIDATTDPATIVGTLFGSSIYGRQFAAGDYIIWDDPTVSRGMYQYEIDQIETLNQNTFTLRRRPKGSPAGRAAFGSVIAAHAGVNFYQLLDPSFSVLWDGTHQVYKFLWDDMIVSAVSATTVGLVTPSVVNLFPVPPDPAAMGLAT